MVQHLYQPLADRTYYSVEYRLVCRGAYSVGTSPPISRYIEDHILLVEYRPYAEEPTQLVYITSNKSVHRGPHSTGTSSIINPYDRETLSLVQASVSASIEKGPILAVQHLYQPCNEISIIRVEYRSVCRGLSQLDITSNKSRYIEDHTFYWYIIIYNQPIRRETFHWYSICISPYEKGPILLVQHCISPCKDEHIIRVESICPCASAESLLVGTSPPISRGT
ncbi:hypothetical protein AVEN_28667-1 [Araneus ventricosus]|uniref:Uncharacterized protein n=1 Tax=Araneus ventricosus TaxID=182803 RepID=A0A4Y2LFB3_ARAVE|nr:hypothetical protein AVEN_28667-1 [Araneus ventricosus]